MAERLKSMEEVREAVRQRYAEAATAASSGPALTSLPMADEECGCGLSSSPLGCGNPHAVSDLREGETVLDLGSGGGEDVFLSASRVGPTGSVYGVDMTDEMLELASAHQREAGIENVDFLKGTIEEVPLPDESVDVIISNCVINLSADKEKVFREAARVLRPGGRFAVTDIVSDPEMDEATRREADSWTSCIAGALTEDEFRTGLGAAGFEAVEVRETHRVHEHACSAIVRARMPAG
jgi:arsenite methyltransferase